MNEILVKTEAVRKLGALEHLFWYHDLSTPFHFVVAVEIEGATSEKEWRLGLDKLQMRHPIFAMAIRQDKHGDLHFVRVDDAPIPLAIVAAEGDKRWETIAEREMATPFDVGDAPLVRATVMLRHDGATIVLAVHHAIADGISVSHALRDLIQIMGGEELHTSPLLPALETLVAGRSDSDDDLGDAPSLGLLAPRVAAVKDDRPVPSLISFKFDAEQSLRIAEAARENGTTVQAALSAATALSYAEKNGLLHDEIVRILTPVNLRRMIGLDERPLLAISIGILNVRNKSKSDFWPLARELKAELGEILTPKSLAESAAAVAQLAAEGMDGSTVERFMFDRFVSNATVSNLGVLPFEKHYGHIRLTAVWGPSVLTGSPEEQVIGVSTFDGRLHLLHTSLHPQVDLLQGVADVLRREAGVRG